MAWRSMSGKDGGATATDGERFAGSERSLGDLFRELADGASTLVRQEVALAKAELKESAAVLKRDIARMAVAAGIGLVGLLCVVAFIVVALGDALDNYWLSALIVGIVFLVVAGVLAMTAVNEMQSRELKPAETMETLRTDKEWARTEVQDLKRRIRA